MNEPQRSLAARNGPELKPARTLAQSARKFWALLQLGFNMNALAALRECGAGSNAAQYRLN